MPKVKSSNATCELIEESRWWLDEHVSRDYLIVLFQGAGWQALCNDSHWDLVDGADGGGRLLLACEYYRMGAMTLVRYEAGEELKVGGMVSLLEGTGFLLEGVNL